MITLEEIQARFQEDRFATENGIRLVDYRKNYAKVEMKITPSHRNARGEVMGGALFTMADFAFAIAANVEHGDTVTTSSTITYLNPVRGDTVYAETFCEKDGRRLCSYVVKITDSEGRHIATVTSTGMRV